MRLKDAILKNKRFLVPVSLIYNSLHRKWGGVKSGRYNRVSVYKGNFISSLHVSIQGKGNDIIIEANGVNQIKSLRISIVGDNNVVRIGKENYFSDLSIVAEKDGNRIIIGNNNHIAGRTSIAALEGTEVTVGDYCLFSSNINIRTGDSHSIISLKDGERINRSKSIHLGNHIWIGQNVNILKGVNIGDDMVIGLGSIVTKSVEGEHKLIVGNPSKVIKENISWSIKYL